MLKHFVLLVLIVTIFVGNGCYHYRLAARGEPATNPQKKTMHSLFWGLVQQNEYADNCLDDVIHEVRASTNVGYVLISVVTLGIWVPLDVEWQCAKGAPPDTSVFGSK